MIQHDLARHEYRPNAEQVCGMLLQGFAPLVLPVDHLDALRQMRRRRFEVLMSQSAALEISGVNLVPHHLLDAVGSGLT